MSSTSATEFVAWEAEAIRRFGASSKAWQFVCPACGQVQSMADFESLGLDRNLAYQECLGRHQSKMGLAAPMNIRRPCNYTSSGMLNLNPSTVIHPGTGNVVRVFAFAERNIGDLVNDELRQSCHVA